ncbi:MAG: iron uptake transporter permease EfeU [Anaerolineae bacterium]
MLAAGLITFREGLEAALIVGIVFGYLKKIERLDQQRYVWGGVIAAIIASLGAALGLQLIGAQFTGRAEEIFEGATMFLAVGVLTWMIFWMRYQGRYIKVALERDVQVAVTAGQNWALFGLAFIAVFREGVETALFLSAATLVSAAANTLWGGFLGLGMALLVGYLIFATAVRLDVKRFFDATSVLLLLFAAGLLAHGVHEFQEAGLIPVIVEHLWDTNHILDEKSALGSILKALLGYNGNPSLLEVSSYLGYWVVVLSSVRWWMKRIRVRLAEGGA